MSVIGLNTSEFADSTLNNSLLSNTNLSFITNESEMESALHTAEPLPCTHELKVTTDHQKNGDLKKKTEKINVSVQEKIDIPGSEGIQDEKMLADESVIPVEEYEDDEITDFSTLATSVCETPQKDMFSHLQPKKAFEDTIHENTDVSVKEKIDIPGSEGIQDEKMLADESVIPVEEYEDDEITDFSTLATSVCETPQKDMFSHLQPKKAFEDAIHENSDMNLETESSYFLQDEGELFQHSFIEVGRRLWPSTVDKQMFTKGCLWSPDGTCLLVPVHLDGMHIVELPSDLYTLTELSGTRDISNLSSAVHVKEGGTVYDYCWYPYMNSYDSATCCWIATRQHEPIQMWDAFTGELRCSYRGYDDVDEVETAISIVFSNDAQRVIGGFKKTIKIFDTNVPGRDCTSIRVKNAVSCFALTTNNDHCVTAGTWTGYISHYDLRAPKLGPLFTLGGHSGGITWLKYSPTLDSNWYLFSGARKDDKILQWDMRNYKEPIQIFRRNVQTNQRIYYDLTPLNSWLASGDTDGLLRIWNLLDKNKAYELHLHQDCCNGVSFHPSLPIISTTSGQFHFVDVAPSEEKTVNYENSLLFLWYGPSTNLD